MLRTRACDNIVYSSNCSRQRRQCRHIDSHAQAGVRLRHASQRGVRVYPQCTEKAVRGMDFWLAQQEWVVDPLNVCLQCPRLHNTHTQTFNSEVNTGASHTLTDLCSIATWYPAGTA